MSLFFDKMAPGKIPGTPSGYIRAGLESDEVSRPDLSFWLGSENEQELDLALEVIQRYTRWLDQRQFLDFQESAT